MRLRRATLEDARLLFDWRNEPSTRQNFGNPDAVGWEEHIKWMKATVSGKVSGRILTIAESPEGLPTGTVRAELTDEGYYDLSYTVPLGWRGQGIGAAITRKFVHEYLVGEKIQCRINDGNLASEKIARALGLFPVSKKHSDRIGSSPLVLWRSVGTQTQPPICELDEEELPNL